MESPDRRRRRERAGGDVRLALEIVANALCALSIILAGRNNVHTWWTGIAGCAVFGVVYFQTQLYADVTLQVFFIAASVVGWWGWLHGNRGDELPVRHAGPRQTALLVLAAVAVTIGYGALLQRFTNAYAPFLDSLILAFSVVGQLLLVWRKVESWWCWLLVNTVAVPVYGSRGLTITAALYVVYWVNAIVSVRHWTRLARSA
ncbi:MAG: nicotinamide riboside transporter PnuC [Acidobacteriota bacterium]